MAVNNSLTNRPQQKQGITSFLSNDAVSTNDICMSEILIVIGSKNDLPIAILREMKEAGLDTPYPHMDISISQEDDIAIKNKAQQK